MRDEQKSYFKTGAKGALIAAKELERQVDNVISEPIVEFQFPEDYETKRG